mmetsp:Transcript_19814/g.37824  ORF Transcript_19814/g.37824 Transcript_19814/m.37824 type:complete len:241 (+) Transcript_19814:709-1431(+)
MSNFSTDPEKIMFKNVLENSQRRLLLPQTNHINAPPATSAAPSLPAPFPMKWDGPTNTFSCIAVSAAFADRLPRAVLLATTTPTIETTSSCSNTSRSTPSAAARRKNTSPSSPVSPTEAPTPDGGCIAGIAGRMPLASTWTLSNGARMSSSARKAIRTSPPMRPACAASSPSSPPPPSPNPRFRRARLPHRTRRRSDLPRPRPIGRLSPPPPEAVSALPDGFALVPPPNRGGHCANPKGI